MPEHYYSDRVGGPKPALNDTLPARTSRGLLAFVSTLIDRDWFAHAFPTQCQDGNMTAGTDWRAVGDNLRAHVPGAPWPLTQTDSGVEDEIVFDVVEYAWALVAEPSVADRHTFMRHDHLRFDRSAGRAAFRREVNVILSRGQAMYELLPNGEVHRTGTPEVQDVLHRLYPASGDARLHELIDEARALYTSHREGDRARALERLWDGFERLKTIDLPGPDKKKQSVQVLLSNFPAGWDSVIEAEMSALTKIGNDFQIRHFESSKTALPDGAADHLFARMGALITELLRASNRLAEPPNDSPTPWPQAF